MDAAERDRKALSFGSVAELYERGRPGYPDDAIRWLCEGSPKHVIDLAAGTGKLTQGLVMASETVLAVEPSLAMLRQVGADASLQRVRATAEAIPVRTAWANLVTVAQAFHWFDLPRAVPEIHRVLRRGGNMGLLWNLREDSTDWVAELSRVIGANDAQVSGVADSERFGFDPSHGLVSASGLFSGFEHRVFQHTQPLDVESLVALVGSRSNVVTKGPREQEEIMNWVREVCRNHPSLRDRETFELPYKTRVAGCGNLSVDGKVQR